MKWIDVYMNINGKLTVYYTHTCVLNDNWNSDYKMLVYSLSKISFLPPDKRSRNSNSVT